MRARKTAYLRIIFTSNQTPFLEVLSSKGIPSGRCVAHCTFEITLLQAIMLTLLLVCAFSPRVHSIPRSPLFINKIKTPRSGVLIISLKTARIWWIFDVSYEVLKILKSQNFDEIVFFSAGSEKSSVLWRTRFFGFRRKSKISQNYDFLI